MREGDLKALWQQREMEQPKISVQQLRDKATAFQKSVRIRDMIEYVACVVVVLAFGSYIWIYPNILTKLGSLVMVVATIFVAYQLRKHRVARHIPLERAANSLLAFHRGELTRRRDLLRNSWRLQVGPLMPGMLLFLGGMAQARPETRLPVLILSGVVVAIGIAISLANLWYARRLQRDIDALDSLTTTE